MNNKHIERINHNALFHKLRNIRRDVENESVSYYSLHYIQTMFDIIPDHLLGEDRVNAMATDQIDAILDNYHLFT